MKRFRMLSSFLLLGAVSVAGLLLPQQAQAQISTKEQIAQQTEFEKTIPKMQITDEFLGLLIPDMTMGETVGVSTNSKGHLFVYSRTNPRGVSRGGTAAMLFEFDQNMKFVKQWGPNNYAASFAHSVRVDKYDNVWMVDEGSGMIIKFDPEGMPVRVWPDAGSDRLPRGIPRTRRHGNNLGGRTAHPNGTIGTFNRRNRCDLGFAGQYLRHRRLRQLAHRQDDERRPLAEGQWERSVPARISSRFRIASPQTPGQHLRRRPQQQSHPGL